MRKGVGLDACARVHSLAAPEPVCLCMAGGRATPALQRHDSDGEPTAGLVCVGVGHCVGIAATERCGGPLCVMCSLTSVAAVDACPVCGDASLFPLGVVGPISSLAQRE
jgi:hypothetical protein